MSLKLRALLFLRLASREVEVVEVVSSFTLPQDLIPVGSYGIQADVNVVIPAVLAAAQRRTPNACVVALAVVLDATCFAAVAAARV